MKVTLKFLGALRHPSGKEKRTIEVKDGSTLIDLVITVSNQIPTLRSSLIDENLQNPKSNALILVNGREISILNGLDTHIKDGDEVVFIPVVHGG